MAENNNAKKDYRTEENRKAINAIMETMQDSNAHYGKGDTANALAVNRYFGDLVQARAEAYILASQIDVYAGKTTALYEYLTMLNDERVKVKTYNKECKAIFKDIDTLKEVITAYNAKQAKPKATTKKRTTKKVNNVKKAVKAS